MRIGHLVQPGRFPTLVYDAGGWWAGLAASGFDVLHVDLNAAWWELLCSPAGYRMATGERQVASWMPSPGEKAAAAAGAGLKSLRESATFSATDSYIAAIAPVASYIEMLNDCVPDAGFSLIAGLVWRNADYSSSQSMRDCATANGVANRLIEAVVPTDLALDLLLVSVTSPEDLCSALSVVSILKRRNRALHACLIDHGFENFSLRPHIDSLRRTGALTQVFDTIIEARDERDVLVAWLADALDDGKTPSGWLREADVTRNRQPTRSGTGSGRPRVPPPTRVFSPEPVLLTRLSERRCYWSRCTFCIHNDKYDNLSVPSAADLAPAIARLAAQVDAGYTTFVFLDEALSPALLRRFSDQVITGGLASRGFRWACRSKLELAHDDALFRLMRSAGCYEILFGVESTSASTLRSMDKYVEGLTRDRVEKILRSAADAGIGLHLNIIGGFPGEDAAELADSLKLVEESAVAPNVTYTVNPFVVFPGTPVFRDPARFGIRLKRAGGDMPAIRDYDVAGSRKKSWKRSIESLPALQERLRHSLGWSRYDGMSGGRAAVKLYFESGHGAILKASPANPFALPTQSPLTQFNR